MLCVSFRNKFQHSPIYFVNGIVRAQLTLVKKKPLLEERHVSAPLLGHYQVSKNVLRGSHITVGGKVTVRAIFQ
jgi:hypothetical protein